MAWNTRHGEHAALIALDLIARALTAVCPDGRIRLGYIGNCSPRFDDRSWRFFHPLPGKDGFAQSQGGGTPQQLLTEYLAHTERFVQWADGSWFYPKNIAARKARNEAYRLTPAYAAKRADRKARRDVKRAAALAEREAKRALRRLESWSAKETFTRQ